MKAVCLAGLAFFVAGCGCQQAAAPDTEASSVAPVTKPAEGGPAANGAANGPATGLAAPTKGSDSELEVNPNANFNTGR